MFAARKAQGKSQGNALFNLSMLNRVNHKRAEVLPSELGFLLRSVDSSFKA